ncbi:hypothetical protein GOBAR_DD00975 [Gossypium barbadense]|nr:hypothetical protein GOBAR_DD00975 [Gossypium barbadense]
MAAFNIQEVLIWKEKIESVIDQHQEPQIANGNKYVSFEYKSGMDNGRTASSSDHECHAQEDEVDAPSSLLRRTTIGNLRIFEELVEVDYLPRSCSRAMKAVGVVEATCEEIFGLVMSMDGTRFEISTFLGKISGPPDSIFDWTQECDSELANHNANNQAFSGKHWRLLQCQNWDCSFQYGSLVEEVDGHTAIIYHRLQLDWFPLHIGNSRCGQVKLSLDTCWFVWPRDLCYVRYWRRNDDGSYVVLFRSREHENCGQQPGYVRAHVESGGFNISPLKSRNGKPRTQVQHLMQVDLKGWGVGYVSSFQQHCLLQMLNSVAGLREWFAQIDERGAPSRIPVMVNMASSSVSSVKTQKIDELSVPPGPSLDQTNAASRNSVMMDEYSDEDEEQMPEAEQEACPTKSDNDAKRTAPKEEPFEKIGLSCFSGNLRRDDHDNSRDCWRISDGNNFRVRSKHFCFNKTKIPAGKHLMDLVAVDWFKDTKRMDHVARRHGCAAQVASEKELFSLVFNVQVPGSTHYSMVFYFVTRELVPGSLLHRFVEGDDEFRNSRLKLIPSVPKGSWIVRQSVGSTPCLLGKAVDCNYIRGPKYLEVDIDIGSSTVANGVLGLVIGVITTLVVDMAFLVQANTTDELPERLIGAVRVSHIELSSAIVPKLDADPS